jgi:hypothetical protein
MDLKNCNCLLCKQPKFLKIVKDLKIVEQNFLQLSNYYCIGNILFENSSNLKLLKYLLKIKPLLFVSFIMAFNFYYINATTLIRWIYQLSPNTFYFVEKRKNYRLNSPLSKFLNSFRSKFYLKKNKIAKCF